MSAPGGLLTLDLSTKTGWTYGGPGQRPISGVWVLPGMADLGRCFAALDNQITDSLALYSPGAVLYEAPIPMMNQTSARLLIGLSAIVECACYRAETSCYEEPQSSVRKAVLGRGRFGNTRDAKEAVMAFCDGKGWRYADDNAADSLVLWAYGCVKLAHRLRRAAA